MGGGTPTLPYDAVRDAIVAERAVSGPGRSRNPLIPGGTRVCRRTWRVTAGVGNRLRPSLFADGKPPCRGELQQQPPLTRCEPSFAGGFGIRPATSTRPLRRSLMALSWMHFGRPATRSYRSRWVTWPSSSMVRMMACWVALRMLIPEAHPARASHRRRTGPGRPGLRPGGASSPARPRRHGGHTSPAAGRRCGPRRRPRRSPCPGCW